MNSNWCITILSIIVLNSDNTCATFGMCCHDEEKNIFSCISWNKRFCFHAPLKKQQQNNNNNNQKNLRKLNVSDKEFCQWLHMLLLRDTLFDCGRLTSRDVSNSETVRSGWLSEWLSMCKQWNGELHTPWVIQFQAWCIYTYLLACSLWTKTVYCISWFVTFV